MHEEERRRSEYQVSKVAHEILLVVRLISAKHFYKVHTNSGIVKIYGMLCTVWPFMKKGKFISSRNKPKGNVLRRLVNSGVRQVGSG